MWIEHDLEINFRLNKKTLRLEASRVKLDKAGVLARSMIRILEFLYLVDVRRDPRTNEMVDCNNLTLINLVIVKLGPSKEWAVTVAIMGLQILGSLFAIMIRYALVHVVYN